LKGQEEVGLLEVVEAAKLVEVVAVGEESVEIGSDACKKYVIGFQQYSDSKWMSWFHQTKAISVYDL
jgi:hypothetical protein